MCIWLHQMDDHTPIDETLRAMDDLIRQGKVRYIGCCNFPAWRVCEALWRSEALHANAFIAIQNSYSLLARTVLEPDLLALCREFGLGAVTYSPLAIGLLSGRFRHGQPPPAGTPWADEPHYRARFPLLMTEQADAIVRALIDIATVRGKTPAQIAIAWLLAHPEITSIISGPDAHEHLDEVSGACGFVLDADAVATLDAVSQPPQPPVDRIACAVHAHSASRAGDCADQAPAAFDALPLANTLGRAWRRSRTHLRRWPDLRRRGRRRQWRFSDRERATGLAFGLTDRRRHECGDETQRKNDELQTRLKRHNFPLHE